METDNCNDNATCTDTIGSFNCTCNLGYTGDGVICTSKLPVPLYIHFGNCCLVFLYHWFEQILMSATQTMEDVNTTVLIPLAASSVTVMLATCWMGMDSTAVVSVSIALGILYSMPVDTSYPNITRMCHLHESFPIIALWKAIKKMFKEQLTGF